MKLLKSHCTFGGQTQFWEHSSRITHSSMKFSTFVPSGGIKGALIWLSGLTCNEENFITKALAQKYLSALNLMIICPDTSPRGPHLPKYPKGYESWEKNWDFGEGAGFYVNATTLGYRDYFHMYDYIHEEIVSLLIEQFAVSPHKISLMGHSMGGHGALVLGLREPTKFQSLSAFAPICHPIKSPWGQKAFLGYLGENEQSLWSQYDACCLMEEGYRHPYPILLDQGLKDNFYQEGYLLPEDFIRACEKNGQELRVNFRENYDHSYFYIATFIQEHIRFHGDALGLL